MTLALIAYDGSEAARAAVRTVGELLSGSRAIVLTVHDHPPSLQRTAAAARVALPDPMIRRGVAALAREIVDAARATAAEGAALAAELGLDTEVDVISSRGAPWTAIIDAAQRHRADAIVCGTSGRGGVSRAILGSTSSALLHHAASPVMVVPDGPRHPPGAVVLAYDGSDASRAAVAAAARLLPGRAALVVHAWASPVRHTLMTRHPLSSAPLQEIVEDLDDLDAKDARALAEQGAALAVEHGLDARAEAIESDSGAWRTVVAAAREAGAAVVVAGSRGRGSMASTLLGSVSAGLVHNAELPTLIVDDAGPTGG